MNKAEWEGKRGRVCPQCGKAGALRREHAGMSPPGARTDMRYCLPCQKWVKPITRKAYDQKYHL